MEEKLYIRNNEALKAPDVVEYLDKDEYTRRLVEIKKCMDDIIYFAENYFYIVSIDKGKHIIELYDYQKNMLTTFQNNGRVVVLAARQSGKSVGYIIFIVWLAIFHTNKQVLICSNKFASSLEFMRRVRLGYEMLPLWLKSGLIEWNKTRIELDNGSSIEGISTSSDSGRGKSCVVGDTDIISIDKEGILYKVPIKCYEHVLEVSYE